ncbi:MAG: hypothetical protein VB009_08330 [Erysipelotrichaceae bacterium]|nr:hypothetical protein [Erysipelotrichaceae bacterium]
MKPHYNIKTITHAAFALLLCLFCLSFFRGPTSIISAFLIPVTIVLFDKYASKYYYLILVSTLLPVTFILFQTQFIFILGYLLLALLLRAFLLNNERKLLLSFFRVINYYISVVFVLYISIRFTDILLKTSLHLMMLSLTNNNAILYLIILMVEGFAITVFNIIIFKLLQIRTNQN